MTHLTADLRTLYEDSDALTLADLVKRREVKPTELMEAAISAAETLNPYLNAVVSTDLQGARARAAQCDGNGTFAGVPYLAKDLSTTVDGLCTTNGSRFYQRNASRAMDDSETIRRLRKSGMIPFGLTNVPENGWALTTEPKLYGPARNPWNNAFSPGGSSGGSAAAVAARIVPIAEGSDGAGSIRMPAGACGLVGLKPSRGRVPVFPAADFWHGSAVFLCLSRTVRDTAAYLDVVGCPCVGDPYNPPIPPQSFLQISSRDPSPLRIGFSTSSPFGQPLDSEIIDSVTHTVKILERMGHHVEPYDLTFSTEACWKAYTRIISVQTALQFRSAEAAFGTQLRSDDVEPFTRANIQRGKSVDAVTHAMDIDTIRYAARDINTALHPFDAFLTPVFPRRPFRIGEWGSMNEIDVDAYNDKNMSDSAFLFPFNVSGQPGISLPIQQLRDGLPIGVQLVGRYGDEGTLLQIATSLEKEIQWHNRKPALLDRVKES